MSVVYFNIKQIALLHMKPSDITEFGKKDIDKIKTKKNKPMKYKLKVINDDYSTYRDFEFTLETVARLERKFHLTLHSKGMGFTIELLKKKSNKYIPVAHLRMNSEELPVDKKFFADMVMQSEKGDRVYLIRMLVHLSDVLRCYKCEFIKPPYPTVDMDFILHEYLTEKDVQNPKSFLAPLKKHSN